MSNNKIPKGYTGTYAKSSDGEDVLIMVSRNEYDTNKKQKGVTKNMANAKPKAQTTEKAQSDFKPTFKKYRDMSKNEQSAFRQGAKTIENRVKENLGFKQKNGNK